MKGRGSRASVPGVDARSSRGRSRFAPARARALDRERLARRLDEAWDHRLTLVTGPAGSGKTTLLELLATRTSPPGPVTWFEPRASDSDEEAVMARLAAAVATARGREAGPWDGLDAWTRAVDAEAIPLLVVIDDFHALLDDGLSAERAVGRLLDGGPRHLHLVIASRTQPALDLSGLRVSGQVLEIGADDLRFRSWEVERLFHDVYREPLPPDDVGRLTRVTEGWAAGLQLFHLATRERSPAHRRRTLESLPGRSAMVREYLARHVVDRLPADLREFLVETCVLERLTGSLCDALLGSTGGGERLAQLERRQIFTVPLEEEGAYRYHEVLRSHLQAALVERVGESEAAGRHRRAGRLLEDAGYPGDALLAYCRGEDWEAVARLLGRDGEELTERPAAWLDVLPPSMPRHEPWILLALARALRAAGRLTEAAERYLEAERAFGNAAPAGLCRRERLALAAWVGPCHVLPEDWVGAVRAATIREPLAVRRGLRGSPGPGNRLAAGIALLLAGHATEAAEALEAVAESPEASGPISAGARLGLGTARLLAGDEAGAIDLDRAAEEGDALGLGWVARTARAALALSDRPDGRSEAAAARLAAERFGDLPGASLAGLLEGLRALRDGEDARRLLAHAAGGFHALGAPVAEAWARAALALSLARAGHPEANRAAERAELMARSLGVRGALGFAYVALAELRPGREEEYGGLAESIAAETGIAFPESHSSAEEPPAPPPMEVRCFGAFRLFLDGREASFEGLKPQARRLLRILALHAGLPLHREVLIEWLWPEATPEAGAAGLHVAVSSLRRALAEAMPARRGDPPIRRDGDAYRLALPTGAVVDVMEFDRAVAAAEVARTRGRRDDAVPAYRRALELYAGDLLPEDGPTEWVVHERDRRRAQAALAGQALAAILLDRGETLEAALAAELALGIDRYRDEAWRLLIDARRRGGNQAAAARAARAYEDLLEELGVGPPARDEPAGSPR